MSLAIHPSSFIFLVKGRARSFLFYQDGRELSTDIYVDSNFFGYEAVLLNEKYSDNVTALEDCEVALVPKEKFFDLMYDKPVIVRKFIQLLSGNIRDKEGQMLGFAYDTVRKRVANALVNIAEKKV